MPLIYGSNSNALMYLKDGPNVNQLQYECCLSLTYTATWTDPILANFVPPVTLTWDTHPTETDANWYWSKIGPWPPPTYYDDVEITLYCASDRWWAYGFGGIAITPIPIFTAQKLGGVTPVGSYTADLVNNFTIS